MLAAAVVHEYGICLGGVGASARYRCMGLSCGHCVSRVSTDCGCLQSPLQQVRSDLSIQFQSQDRALTSFTTQPGAAETAPQRSSERPGREGLRSMAWMESIHEQKDRIQPIYCLMRPGQGKIASCYWQALDPIHHPPPPRSSTLHHFLGPGPWANLRLRQLVEVQTISVPPARCGRENLDRSPSTRRPARSAMTRAQTNYPLTISRTQGCDGRRH